MRNRLELAELIEICRPALQAVMEHGGDKKPPKDWTQKPEEAHIDHLTKHLDSLLSGERFDLDSGQNHLAHIALRALMALGCRLV